MNTKNFIKNLKVSYDSGFGDNLGKDFYSPCLDRCKEYKRMTGEFTSNVIFDWGRALLKVLNNEEDKCMVKIIANPSLKQYDIDTLKQTLQHRNDEDFWNKLSDHIYEEAEHLVNKDLDRQEEREVKLKIFSYLISTKKLILKFGFPRHIPRPGMFHNKKGIFYFEDGLKVGFNGGPNESHGGHELNIESIDVFTNINGDEPHINDSEQKFDLAWNDKAPGFITKPLSQKTLNKIKINAPSTKLELDQIIKKAYEKKKDTLGDLLDEEQIEKLKNISLEPISEEKKKNYLDVTEKKWEFQKKAREEFISAKYGILEMATGTGKTRTALSIITQLIKDKKINNIIIQLEKNNLIDQWEENIREWLKSETYVDINLLKYAQNKNQLEEFILGLHINIVQLLIVSKHNLPELLNRINEHDLSKTIIIHDEVHGLFSEKIAIEIEGKQKNIGYRLGLSATIENKFDLERTKKLFNEIGRIVYEYPLKRAIKEGVLVEFDLIDLPYKLLESDKKERSRAYALFDIDIKNGVNPAVAEKKRNLTLSDIKKNCVDKVRVFKNNFEKISKYLHRSFIFADEKVYVDKVSNILIHKNINFRKHTGSDGYENINRFSRGEVDCLLNCEKLSEGIDVKSVNTIVLFATPQGIQLIQRLGRVLRTDKKYPDKRACVIDFFEEEDMANKNGSDYNRFLKLEELSKIKKFI